MSQKFFCDSGWDCMALYPFLGYPSISKKIHPKLDPGPDFFFLPPLYQITFSLVDYRIVIILWIFSTSSIVRVLRKTALANNVLLMKQCLRSCLFTNRRGNYWGWLFALSGWKKAGCSLASAWLIAQSWWHCRLKLASLWPSLDQLQADAKGPVGTINDSPPEYPPLYNQPRSLGVGDGLSNYLIRLSSPMVQDSCTCTLCLSREEKGITVVLRSS